MTEEPQWGVEHISFDGVSAGVMPYYDEPSARDFHRWCEIDGRECKLMRRDDSSSEWAEAS